ncbi:MAG: 2-phospho-L-lactate guanylyltransferase [Actinomycetota bacterium]
MPTILIPVKHLDQAKGRLGDLVDDSDRRALALAMLEDVISQTVLWPTVTVTGDPTVASLCRSRGCEVIDDPGAGLNRAIDTATATLKDETESLLVIPADVPLVASSDITSLFSIDAEVLVVGSADRGTNAFLRRPPQAIDAAFGDGSAKAHCDSAEARGLTWQMVTMPSLTLDVDDAEDLLSLARSDADRRSVALAKQIVASKGWRLGPFDDAYPHP